MQSPTHARRTRRAPLLVATEPLDLELRVGVLRRRIDNAENVLAPPVLGLAGVHGARDHVDGDASKQLPRVGSAEEQKGMDPTPRRAA